METPKKKNEAILTAIFASNFPDLDIFYSSISGFGNLSYLLHHRGHTHTLLLTPLVAVVAFLAASLLTGNKARWDWRMLFLGWVGALVHIAFDFLNSYGVHPFWPMDNHWVYGDSLFIIEPSIWFCLLAYAFWEVRTKYLRAFWGLITLLCFVIFWWISPTALLMKIILSLLLILMFGYHARERGSLPMAWSSLASILFIFIGCGIWSEIRLRDSLLTDYPKDRVIQVVRNPSPGNPFCWDNLVVFEAEPRVYVAKFGTQTLLPGLMDCPPREMRSEHPKLQSIDPTEESKFAPREIFWTNEYVDSFTELRSLAETNCIAAAALRFYRAPSWTSDQKMEDLRYLNSGSGRAFSLVDIQASGCPRFVPPWIPPVE